MHLLSFFTLLFSGGNILNHTRLTSALEILRKRTLVGVQPLQNIPLLLGLGLPFFLIPCVLFCLMYICFLVSTFVCHSILVFNLIISFCYCTRLDKLNSRTKPEWTTEIIHNFFFSGVNQSLVFF